MVFMPVLKLMASAKDFLILGCTPEMIQTGATFMTRALTNPVHYQRAANFDRLRQGVVHQAVELAFRRHLTEADIPHQLVESASFTDADALDVSFGGRRAAVFGQLVCRRESIQEVQKAPKLLEAAMAYLPEEGRPSGYRDVDLYVFAALTGLVTRSHEEVQKALAAEQPLHLVYPTPEPWAMPEKWAPLGELPVKGDISQPLALTLHGLDRRQGYLSRTVTVPSRQRVSAGVGFYALNALHTGTLPDGPVGVHSPGLGETLLVSSYKWGNIWVYGMRMYFLGYVSQGDFYKDAKELKRSQLGPLDACGEEHLVGVPVSGLRPVEDLFVRAENWAQSGK